MANGIFVDSAGMKAKGVQIGEHSANLSSQISSLSNQVEELMQIWKGEAANTFNEACKEQIVNLNNFESLVHEMSEKIVAGANTFNQTEEDNVSAVSGLF